MAEHKDVVIETVSGEKITICPDNPLVKLDETDSGVTITEYKSKGERLDGMPIIDREHYTVREIPKDQIIEKRTVVKPTSGCFISTACVEACELPDDCEVLQVLRHWRDTYLVSRAGGAEMLHDYYLTAPAVVSRIAARSDAHDIWKEVYQNLLLAVDHIKQGNNDDALAVYVSTAKSLHRLV
jgi:hypothetical protein